MTEPPAWQGVKPLGVNVVVVGLFEEEKEGTNINSELWWRVRIQTSQVI